METFELSGCKEGIMAQARSGDTVMINYTGRLDDGTVFKTSCGYKPLKFRIGKSSLIPAFQETVVGMKPGNSRTVKIVACEAYGPRREQMVAAVALNKFPGNVKPYVGLELDIRQRNGKVSLAKVTGVSECSVTLDGNHPLAGKDLTFDIQLVEII
jgi:FKBP-type peptidyl-prolyl cis-trans isomerase 2